MKKQESKSQGNKLNLQKLTLMIQVCDLFDRIQANHRNVAHSGQEKCMNCSQEIEITRVPNRNLGTEEYYK